MAHASGPDAMSLVSSLSRKPKKPSKHQIWLSPESPQPVVLLSGENVPYSIQIKTGTVRGSEVSGSDFYLRIYGDLAESHVIHDEISFNRKPVAAGSVVTINCSTFNLGKLTYLEVWKNSWGRDDPWFVDTITITQGADKFHFICYSWIADDMAVFVEGDGCLPHHDPLKRLRETLLDESRGFYAWRKFPGRVLPNHLRHPHYSQLPANERWNDEVARDFRSAFVEVIKTSALTSLMTKLKIHDFDDYKKLFGTLGTPLHLEWESDEDFGKRRLQSSSLCLIERVVSKLPDKFAVTFDMVKAFLRPQATSLDSEIAENRLYFIDYANCDGISTAKGKYMAAPLLLMYRND